MNNFILGVLTVGFNSCGTVVGMILALKNGSPTESNYWFAVSAMLMIGHAVQYSVGRNFVRISAYMNSPQASAVNHEYDKIVVKCDFVTFQLAGLIAYTIITISFAIVFHLTNVLIFSEQYSENILAICALSIGLQYFRYNLEAKGRIRAVYLNLCVGSLFALGAYCWLFI